MLSTYNTQALTQALTSDPALSSPRIIFRARGLQHKWQSNRPSGRLDILDCTTLLAGHSSTAFLRQNGEILSVVLISAILISLLSAIGGLFFYGEWGRSSKPQTQGVAAMEPLCHKSSHIFAHSLNKKKKKKVFAQHLTTTVQQQYQQSCW